MVVNKEIFVWGVYSGNHSMTRYVYLKEKHNTYIEALRQLGNSNLIGTYML